MREFYSVAIILSVTIIFLGMISMNSFGQEPSLKNMALRIFNDRTLVIPQTVKNFVILIPNEAHESPLLPKDQRLINQPYVPQNIVVGPDTKIIWFSGDVGHTRKVGLTDENSRKIYNAVLHFNSASRPLSLNETGKYNYSESGANKDDPKFVMNGSIVVSGLNNQSNFGNYDNRSKSTFDTMSILMVPTKDIKKQANILDKNNVNILDKFSFKDLRETPGGGGNQTLLVLGSNDPMAKTISVLKKITSTLPYS